MRRNARGQGAGSVSTQRRCLGSVQDHQDLRASIPARLPRARFSGFSTRVFLSPTEHSVLRNIPKVANNAHGASILPLVSVAALIRASLITVSHHP